MVRVHHASFRTPTGSSSSRCWRRAISTTCGASGLYGRSSGPTVSCCRRRRCRGSSGTAPAGQSATTTRSGCPDGGTRAGFPLGVCCYHRSVVIVLGISETHCATATVLRDGAIVGCASEERFSRLKNDAGYPRVAIDALLRELALSPAAVDRVVLAGTRIPSYDWMNRVMRDPAYAREYYAVRLDAPRRGLTGRARRLGAKLGLLDPAPGKSPLPERERRVAVTTHLGIDADRVSLVDHHTCHAAAAYFGSPFAGASALVLTNDNSGDRLALGGGVFMNVKANMLLAEEPWVTDLFVFPSCGDESNAVGAAYLGYLELCARRGIAPAPRPFGPAYLGPGIDDAEVEAVIRRRDLAGRHRVSEPERIEERIAELLASDGVVARCAGRMEFGARALGNRSILANPADHRVVPLINRMIKNRDFWMPFAPSVLREREADYLVNPKGLASPYMMLAFPTNPKRRDEIVAAIHPHDSTARAHIVDEAWNPPYYRVLREFEARTGIGAVLNTSFNLHGEPLVASPEDAVDTFERSGLPHLALGRYLISKRTP